MKCTCEFSVFLVFIEQKKNEIRFVMYCSRTIWLNCTCRSVQSNWTLDYSGREHCIQYRTKQCGISGVMKMITELSWINKSGRPLRCLFHFRLSLLFRGTNATRIEFTYIVHYGSQCVYIGVYANENLPSGPAQTCMMMDQRSHFDITQLMDDLAWMTILFTE